jgi:hypothetical protein
MCKKVYMEGPGVNGRIILKLMLRKYSGKVWVELIYCYFNILFILTCLNQMVLKLLHTFLFLSVCITYIWHYLYLFVLIFI